LDNELRLLTPTDPDGAARDEGRQARDDEGRESASSSSSRPSPLAPRYYQLTHDYLVHSLRDWLTRKQKETRRGRAELLLADRAALWTARSENRQLPSLLQWLQIRWLTEKQNWTAPQRQLMAKGARYHGVRGLATIALVILLSWAGWDNFGRFRAQAWRHRLHDV